MRRKIVHISKLERKGAYRLKLWFTDGQAGEWDFADLATRSGALAADFRDPAYFDRVFLEAGALTWPNGYDWRLQALHDDMAAAGVLTVEAPT